MGLAVVFAAIQLDQLHTVNIAAKCPRQDQLAVIVLSCPCPDVPSAIPSGFGIGNILVFSAAEGPDSIALNTPCVDVADSLVMTLGECRLK